MNPYTLKACDLEILVAEGADFYPITIDALHLLIEHQYVPEGAPIELLGGHLIYKDRRDADQAQHTREFRRALVLKRLVRLARELDRFNCHLQTRERVSFRRGYEPAPDAAVVRGTVEDYQDRLPEPSDLSCVIRVADQDLDYDRKDRLESYAEAGIPNYVIIDLPNRLIEIYSEPNDLHSMQASYAKRLTFVDGETLNLPMTNGQHLAIDVSRLLQSA